MKKVNTLRKALAAVLSAAVLCSTAAVPVFAAPSETKKYSYVALGDSIAAGYGLTEKSEGENILDPALMITDELLANPISNAYAAVLGTYLDALGNEYGIETSATNLSATAYRAYDVANTITTEGYKGEIATWIIEYFVGEGKSAPLSNYHDLFVKYLSEADLVSIQLGGNDIVMEAIVPMANSDNPILVSTAIGIMMILFGEGTEIAIGAAVQTLLSYENVLTNDNFTDAAQYFSYISTHSEDLVEGAATHVNEVVDAVQTVNPDADIALVSMFNPYGNSLECDGKIYNCLTVFRSILAKSASILMGCEISADDADASDSQLMNSINEKIPQFDGISKIVGKIKKYSAILPNYQKLLNKYKAKLKELAKSIIEETAYPIQYLTAGKNVDPQIKLLNEKLQAIAAETGCTFVDTYGIGNECNLDPHPNANGHKEIADSIYDTMKDTIIDRMEDKVTEPLVNNSTISASRIKVGKKIKVRAVAEGGAGDYEYAVYYKKVRSESMVRVLDYGKKKACYITPSMAAKYEVIVKVRDRKGNEVVKTLPLQVTRK